MVGVAAAFQGARAAPAAAVQGIPLPLDGICNGTLPSALGASLARNYAACGQRIQENPRLFGGLGPSEGEALCIAQAGLDTGFGYALRGRPSEIPVIREGLHRLARSRTGNPLPAPTTAGRSLDDLRHINFQDYRHSASTRHAANLERQVEVLRAHIAPHHRGSLADARRAAAAPACRRAWRRELPNWVRAEIAERSTLVTMREVGRPESISRGQADVLRAELAQMRFGHNAMKRRMREDALVALVGSTDPAE
ncbi:hypothetical protein [uncultured Stenotrophomonas sp.]|uniref:hypothetical protein n=1 Tax=uncultured Stenotrophomonas sp. TaxID=165438 RepID=UPI0028E985A8|nr:hypothetical protein [uncultured Stenotrophomonas sp.]